eukprot:7892328-Ditylum_brightwellii.AAC.1
MHNMQPFTWEWGRASYAFWSLAGLLQGNLVVWGEKGATSSPCKGPAVLKSCFSHGGREFQGAYRG